MGARLMIALACVVVMGGCCEPGEKQILPYGTCGEDCESFRICNDNGRWGECQCEWEPWDDVNFDAPPDTASDLEDVPADLPLDEVMDPDAPDDPVPDPEDAADIPPDPESDVEDVEDGG